MKELKTERDDTELFRQFIDGDEDAFRRLFTLYFPFIVAYAIKITRTQHSAEEIAQETFVRLWKKRTEFTESGGLGAWLYKVAANLAFDHLKREALRNKLHNYFERQPGDDWNSASILELKQTKAVIDETIKELPGQQQTAFRLSREEGLTHQEIADRMDISVNTVKNHIIKALQTIRTAIKKSLYFLSCFFI